MQSRYVLVTKSNRKAGVRQNTVHRLVSIESDYFSDGSRTSHFVLEVVSSDAKWVAKIPIHDGVLLPIESNKSEK